SFQAAKRVALALYSLIETAFPTDSLYILGFSEYAHEIKKGELPETTWNAWMPGTNIHHALILSRQLLARHKGQTRQVILITDGEPTAHLENGEAFFSYPPSYETIQETLLEVKRCTQEGIVINTFMLESSYYLMDFINQVSRINKGRAFYTTPDKLGQYILVDYLSHRRKRIG
ncbi:MAG: VWA domain-containing protein, partial [Chloroflexota bacterium]